MRTFGPDLLQPPMRAIYDSLDKRNKELMLFNMCYQLRYLRSHSVLAGVKQPCDSANNIGAT